MIVVKRRVLPPKAAPLHLGDFVTFTPTGQTGEVHTIAVMGGKRIVIARAWDGRGRKPSITAADKLYAFEIDFKLTQRPEAPAATQRPIVKARIVRRHN
jgi:hypothetical protein